MKLLMLVLALLCVAGVKRRFKVECPECRLLQIEEALQVSTTGGYTTEAGVFTQRSATFRCVNKKCRAKFTVPCDPVMRPHPRPATEVTSGVETRGVALPPFPPPLPAKVESPKKIQAPKRS